MNNTYMFMAMRKSLPKQNSRCSVLNLNSVVYGTMNYPGVNFANTETTFPFWDDNL